MCGEGIYEVKERRGKIVIVQKKEMTKKGKTRNTVKGEDGKQKLRKTRKLNRARLKENKRRESKE